jgi:hypothetical protein
MTDEKNIQAENVPPEEYLTCPPDVDRDQSAWLVVAKNRRVNRSWEDLLLKAPESALRCYENLCNQPMTRLPGRVFPLKGKLYKGAWEYEVTSGDRVFYVPNPQTRKVVVYYAGGHPSTAPAPPV